MGFFVAAAICGLGVGVLSGLFGIGGGTIMVPIFRLGFGLSALQATGTSLFTMIFASAAGSVTHIRNKTCLVPLGLIAGCCGAFMSPVGVRLANLSPAWLVMLATALVIAYSSITMLRKGLAMPKNTAASKGDTLAHEADAHSAQNTQDGQDHAQVIARSALVSADEASTATTSEQPPKLSRKQYIIGALAGLAAGLAGGYVGLGGGFLMVPIFLAGVGLSMKQASGTSLLAVSILALSGSIAQAMHGNLVVLAGFAMAVGSIPGAILGATLVKKVPERSLRVAFGVLLLAISAVLVVNEFVS